MDKRYGKYEMEELEVDIEKVRKNVEVKYRRVGGYNYKVKVEVSKVSSNDMEMSWIVEDDSKRGDK